MVLLVILEGVFGVDGLRKQTFRILMLEMKSGERHYVENACSVTDGLLTAMNKKSQ